MKIWNKYRKSDRGHAGKRLRSLAVCLLAAVMVLSLSGCVDQSQGKNTSSANPSATSAAKTSGSGEQDQAESSGTGQSDGNASDGTKSANGQPVIIATSMATVDICDKLNIDLAGVPDSSLYELPERYKDLPKVGTAMAVDMEKVAPIKPDWILSPVSLISDLKPKYEAQGYQYAFLNLSSVEGMYKSIEQLGQIFGKEKEAEALVSEFTEYYDAFRTKHEGQKKPSVLILMGLPGSYVVATENSYVGSLVRMAGGKNVYAGEKQDFINVNTEDMLKRDPDIILRTAHALPDQVMEMFADEFKTNDIWKHFRAVKNDKVYDLSYKKFGMSANFQYQDAIADLEKIFYQ